MGCVYRATNIITHKQYIGKTILTLQKRRHQHWVARCKDATYFHNALNKYGQDAFVWEVLSSNDDENALHELEKFYIKECNTMIPNGYNMTLGGEGVSGLIFSPEWRERNRKRAESLGIKVYCLETDTIYNSYAEAARILNLDYSLIGQCIKGKNRHHKHYHFSNSDEQSVSELKRRCSEVADDSKRPCTEEEKRKMSIRCKGIKKPASYSEKLSIRMKRTFADMPEDVLKAKMSQMSKGKLCGKSNPSARAIILEETGEYFPTISEAVQKYNLPLKAGSNICSCCLGKLKSAYGFHWRYADEYKVAI